MTETYPIGTRPWYEQWQPVAEFQKAIYKYRPPPDRFRERTFKFWREAWVASVFLDRTAPRWVGASIRLTPEGSPFGDFEIDNGSLCNFQIAEAMDGVMQPIWKKMQAAGEPVLPELDDAASGALARRLIPELISHKAAKSHSPGTGLILYVNLWTWFDTEDLRELSPTAPVPFSSIWLLAADKATDLLALGRSTPVD